MARYGVLTQKRSTLLPRTENRWWVKADGLPSAQVIASSIVDAENILFGTGVTTYNTHAWLPDSDPNVFSNQPRSDPGLAGAGNPLAPFIVAEFIFGTESSYLAYKYFRVQVDSGFITGSSWTASYLAILSDAAEAFSSLLEVLTDDNGIAYTSVAFNQLYNHRQLHPKWYNRKPPAPTP